MITILFNTETNKPISNYLNGGYTVDGLPQAVELPIVELEVITTARPEITATQRATSTWVADTILNQYRMEWTVTDKTEEEQIADFETAALQAEESLKEKALERLAIPEIDVIYTESAVLTDEQAFEQVDIFPPYRVGVAYTTGNRIQWNGKLWKVLKDHTSAIQWRPNEAVSEYVEVTPEGVIADWVQPLGSHDAYQIGDKVTHGGFTWESTVADNTWEPGVYGWVTI